MAVHYPDYKAPFWMVNKHLETIVPAMWRKVEAGPFRNERITTPDNDFLDLDWLENGSHKAVILSHGLEGNSQRPYMIGMAKIFYSHGYDTINWNFRGCSGEINKQLRFYHSGATDDLDTVVRHVISTGKYDQINLIGFSLGGNLTLKYLGEQGEQAKELLSRAVAISAPLHLSDSCQAISSLENSLYEKQFLKELKQKVAQKAKLHPNELDISALENINTLWDFDNQYTAPLHGFKDAEDYYRKCSSLWSLKNIRIPTLIINAKNDTFLSASCFPVKELDDNPWVELDITAQGGHVGFAATDDDGHYWSEKRALEFVESSNR
ncbi:MAG: alpha/beta fold hydrolase [Cyclobacteriaceae bacterium]|nr:alpha/beta fold hydrolase [Cyclobacteriaceae bacterium]